MEIRTTFRSFAQDLLVGMTQRLRNFMAFVWVLSLAVFAGGLTPTVFANFFQASGDLNIFLGAVMACVAAIVVSAIAYVYSLTWLDSSAELLPGFQAALFAHITLVVSAIGILNPDLAQQFGWLIGFFGAGIILLATSYTMPAVDEYTNHSG